MTHSTMRADPPEVPGGTEASSRLRRLDPADAERLRQSFAPDPDNAPPFAPGLKWPGTPLGGALDDPALRALSALSVANTLARQGRRNTYDARLRDPNFAQTPIVLVEGDSWAEFPVELTDMIAHSSNSFIVDSLAAAGDTLANMLAEREYLDHWTGDAPASAMLLSAGGNDIIGADETGHSALLDLVRRSPDGRFSPALVNEDALAQKIAVLTGGMREIAAAIDRPLFVHGYSYVHPGGNPGEWRNPTFSSVDKWLGRSLRTLGYVGQDQHDLVIRHLIDRLNEALAQLAATWQGQGEQKIVHIDFRTVQLDMHADWYDEIHPNTQGFKKLSARIFEVLVEHGITRRRT